MTLPSRVAALYDVHGNLPALEAVLAEVEAEDVDAIVVGGDVSVGPWPSETLDRLRALGDRVHWIRGNADRELTVGEPGYAPPLLLDWVRDRLPAEDVRFLYGLPPQVMLDVDSIGSVLFVHATPRNDVEIFTALTPEERLLPLFAAVEAGLVVCGHTHMQFDRTVAGVRVVNAGSVGMPYEDVPGAYWALLGAFDGGPVGLRVTRYDRDAALAAIAEQGWPDPWPQGGRDEVSEFFESRAVGA